MRIRLPVGRTLFFVAAFLFALVALLPLRLALSWFGLDAHGLAAREASGTVWHGALREAQFGSVVLGDVEARLNTLPLLLGRARVSLERPDENGRFEGAATVTRRSFGLDDLSGQLRLGQTLAPLPIAALDLGDVTVRFSGGVCAAAEGLVRAAIAGEVGGVALPSGLSGNARCAGGALLLPLASRSGMEQLNLRIFADGRYRADLFVRPSDDAVRDRLLASGFTLARGGYAMRLDGRF